MSHDLVFETLLCVFTVVCSHLRASQGFGGTREQLFIL